MAPGKYRPYYLKSVGKENSAYIRINGTSRPADRWRLQELELEGQRIYYDTLPEIGMDYDEKMARDLCDAMHKAALSACETQEERETIREVTIEKLENMGLLQLSGHTYTPTHAFRLMTINGIRYAKIQCALFKGTDRDLFIDRKEFDGPIYQQIEEAYQFLCRHTNVGAQINGIVRRDVYDLPVRAIREAIINAAGHRSYLDDSCIQLSIYDDRVDVYSPGALYGGLSISEALSGKSKCRNAAISEAFHYMKIMEAWGTGLGRIQSACEEYGLPEPLIEEDGNGFRVTFYRKVGSADRKVGSEQGENPVTAQKMGSNGQKVGSEFAKYEAMLTASGITKIFISNIEIVFQHVGRNVFKQSDVMEYLDCSKTKAGNVLGAMKKAGVVEKVTGMGLGRYQFV